MEYFLKNFLIFDWRQKFSSEAFPVSHACYPSIFPERSYIQYHNMYDRSVKPAYIYKLFSI